MLKGSSSINLYKRLVGKHPKMNVFLKDNIPIRLHYSNNRRISPVVVYSEPGWTIVRSRKSVAKFSKYSILSIDMRVVLLVLVT